MAARRAPESRTKSRNWTELTVRRLDALKCWTFDPKMRGIDATSSPEQRLTTTLDPVGFDQPELLARLATAEDGELDALTFGVIGFGPDGVVVRYNAWESRAAGLSPQRVLGHPLFTVVAPCMNNFMVAQRFEDAAAAGDRLDAVIDYVLTLRMKPVRVKLRLLAEPGASLRYVLVQRLA